MRVITHNDKIFIDGMAVEPPKPSDCICISQHNGNVYVNGFEWTGNIGSELCVQLGTGCSAGYESNLHFRKRWKPYTKQKLRQMR